ncbi:MAG: hypothetical protein JWQ38_416 [Flavipsychrobacter sp.]|nr:hypothetical protein [Flavipsychrobacter sp.]
MGRVKLKFPDDNPVFTTTISVRIGDINYGNHVGNDAILSIIQESRVQMLHRYGYNELDIAGCALIMADVMISYRGEAFYGDSLIVKIYVDELTPKSFDLLYHISVVRNGMETDIAHAKTGMACFDYKTRKIINMNDALKTLLTPAQ